jgi:hypothetical protein
VPFDTLRTDMTRSQGDLWSSFDRTTQYEIRRAERRDELLFDLRLSPASSDISDFLAFHDRTAPEHARVHARLETLTGYQRAGCLRMSRALDRHGRILVWHVYLAQNDIVLLLHACSAFRNAQPPIDRPFFSRANRWLHWRDIQHFQEMETTVYDWGGYYLGRANPALRGVNEFKRKFGGELIRAWDGHAGVTVRGKLYLLARLARHRRAQRDTVSGALDPAGTPGLTSRPP